MNELYLNIIVSIVVAVLLIVSRYAIPYIKNRIEGTKWETVINYASKFVEAAEQTMFELTGEDKKDWVTQILKSLLIAKNISLSDEQISAIIESAVYEMNQAKDIK